MTLQIQYSSPLLDCFASVFVNSNKGGCIRYLFRQVCVFVSFFCIMFPFWTKKKNTAKNTKKNETNKTTYNKTTILYIVNLTQKTLRIVFPLFQKTRHCLRVLLCVCVCVYALMVLLLCFIGNKNKRQMRNTHAYKHMNT